MQLMEQQVDGPTRDVLEGVSAIIRAVRCAEHRAAGFPDTGLRRADASVLRVLTEAGELRTGDLAHRLGVDASVVSRQLTALGAEGLVSRHQDEADARASLAAVTDLGRSKLEALYAAYAQRLHATLGDLTDEELLAAADALHKVAAAIAPPGNGDR